MGAGYGNSFSAPCVGRIFIGLLFRVLGKKSGLMVRLCQNGRFNGIRFERIEIGSRPERETRVGSPHLLERQRQPIRFGGIGKRFALQCVLNDRFREQTVEVERVVRVLRVF